MIDHLRALAVFSSVADAGSFRAAAKKLGLSASVVSHHVTSLERYLDTPLIYRTTRKLSLTAAGEQLAGSARAMLRSAEEGFSEVGHQTSNPTGLLTVTAPAIMQYARFVTRTSTFMKHNPNAEISMSFTDRRINLVEEGFDLGLRVGRLEDSSLMSKKLAEGRLHLCASPDYLRSKSPIRQPRDLEKLEAIDLAGVSRPVILTKSGRERKQHSVHMPYRITVDSGFAARRMAEEGCGIVVMPDFFVRERIAEGHLMELLPDWRAPSYGIYAVWPPNSGTNRLRSAYVDFVGAISKTEPQTDRNMRN
ncbi:LysR family transcriptional regulator [Hoeflea prorocentri]|uniref:LysR family transcriptional regulator n=1 Tax=Hoeflea prorocentri TaxID=1922333 RepID=A0A9X3ZIW8_9HYPH|nr:LysR family transcriptional regulator [Hoeflea prorocentri]MCY6382306.1 LysR family transcriptional regulator [Hoeflea prorocentri]MDA5400106.1 LysR family transcriptional regulator [Hoeflea prorocentri]